MKNKILILIILFSSILFLKSVYSDPNNFNSTAFGYYISGTPSSTLFKFKLGTPGTVTIIGNAQPNIFCAGDWANPDGIWGFYVVDNNVIPAVFRVDTVGGNITNLGNISGILSGHSIAIMEWDHTTGKFFIISNNPSQTSEQLYYLNWATRTAVPIGTQSTICAGVAAGGFSRNGTFYIIDVIQNESYRINKVTGVPVLNYVTWFNSNRFIDGAFDKTDGKFYVTADNGTISELLEFDSLLIFPPLHIGSFPFNNVIALCIIPQQTNSVSQNSTVISDSFLLEQNYPNPFNSRTNIRFEIIESGFATLKVYNSVGEEVTTLLKEYLKAGTYEIPFDSGNLSSGIYFYRLFSGNYSDTKKMILLK